MLHDFERGQKTLWVTSPGGHLAELLRIEANLGANGDSLWVVPETPRAGLSSPVVGRFGLITCHLVTCAGRSVLRVESVEASRMNDSAMPLALELPSRRVCCPTWQ